MAARLQRATGGCSKCCSRFGAQIVHGFGAAFFGEVKSVEKISSGCVLGKLCFHPIQWFFEETYEKMGARFLGLVWKQTCNMI